MPDSSLVSCRFSRREHIRAYKSTKRKERGRGGRKHCGCRVRTERISDSASRPMRTSSKLCCSAATCRPLVRQKYIKQTHALRFACRQAYPAAAIADVFGEEKVGAGAFWAVDPETPIILHLTPRRALESDRLLQSPVQDLKAAGVSCLADTFKCFLRNRIVEKMVSTHRFPANTEWAQYDRLPFLPCAFCSFFIEVAEMKLPLC